MDTSHGRNLAEDITAVGRYFILSDHPFPILSIGDHAANVLLPDTEGSILATFSKITYLGHALDEIIWLVTEEAPMHRRAIQLYGSLPGFSVDTPYIVKNKAVILESGDSIDFSLAKIWVTPSLSPEYALPIKDLKEYLDRFLSSCENFPSPTGLGIFIPKILDLYRDHMLPHTTKDLALASSQRLAWPTIKHIARASLTQDIDELFEHGEELIGLGEGLTPSGDDFMGGLLFCIRSLQDLYGTFHASAINRLDDFLEKSKSRTNLISYTMIKDHANGHASETLHNFIHAILTGWDMETMKQLGSELIQMGHSTGWDLLAGVLTGILSIANMKK